MTFFLCLICAHQFYSGKFFSQLKKVCMVMCSIVHPPKKEIHCILCFGVYVKTRLAKVSIFFSWWLHIHRRYKEKKKTVAKNWPILPWSTLCCLIYQKHSLTLTTIWQTSMKARRPRKQVFSQNVCLDSGLFVFLTKI